MNAATNSRTILQISFLGLLALVLPTGCTTPQHEPKSAAVPTSKLAQEMIGTWIHVGVPGQVFDAPASGQRLKFRTGAHWNLTRSDPNTGLVVEHTGGTYTLTGDEYVETQTYSDANWKADNGKSWRFEVKIEGDMMTQTGIGNPYTEVWKRAK